MRILLCSAIAATGADPELQRKEVPHSAAPTHPSAT